MLPIYVMQAQLRTQFCDRQSLIQAHRHVLDACPQEVDIVAERGGSEECLSIGIRLHQ